MPGIPICLVNLVISLAWSLASWVRGYMNRQVLANSGLNSASSMLLRASIIEAMENPIVFPDPTPAVSTCAFFIPALSPYLDLSTSRVLFNWNSENITSSIQSPWISLAIDFETASQTSLAALLRLCPRSPGMRFSRVELIFSANSVEEIFLSGISLLSTNHLVAPITGLPLCQYSYV